MSAKYNFINDEEFILKVKIRTDELDTAQNIALVVQEIFDDMSSSTDSIDVSIRRDIIHKRFK